MLAQLNPLRVERTRLVRAVVGVSTEVIALRLQQVRRQAFLSIAVVIRQGRSEGRHRDAELHARDDDISPSFLRVGRCLLEVRRE